MSEDDPVSRGPQQKTDPAAKAAGESGESEDDSPSKNQLQGLIAEQISATDPAPPTASGQTGAAVDSRWGASRGSAGLSSVPDLTPGYSRDRKSSGGPNMITDPARKKGGGPNMIAGQARKKGAGPDMINDPARKPDAEPNMVTDPATRRGADPNMVTDPARKPGADPNMVTDPARRRGADPNMVTDPVRKPNTDPNMVTDPARKPGSAPRMVTDPGKNRGAGPRMVTDPTRQRSADADMIPGGASDDDAAEPQRQAVPPEEAVKSFVAQFASEIERAGIDMSIEHRESMKIEISCSAWDLTVIFMLREKPFDSVVVKRLHGQPDDDTDEDNAEPQSSGLVARAKALFGRKQDEEDAAEEATVRVQQWIAAVRDFNKRELVWEESLAPPEGTAGADERVALVAELFDRSDQRRWLVELIDSKQAARIGAAKDYELSSAGIRNLLAPLLGGLHSAIKKGIQSS